MSEFEKALEKYAKYVIQQSRSNLTRKGNKSSGKLYQSLGYKIQGSKVKFEGEEYGVYQDQGVRGAKSTYSKSSKSPFRYTSKMPPSSVFDKWTIKSSIAPRDKKGRFLKRKSLNYIIANSIFKKGIRATMFFTKPFEEALPLFEDEIMEGFINDNL